MKIKHPFQQWVPKTTSPNSAWEESWEEVESFLGL